MPDFVPSQSSEAPIGVDEAQRRVLEAVVPLGTERVAVTELAGRVLREDVTAAWDVPGVDNSAMDGYAVRGADVADASKEAPARLQVIDDVPAGLVTAIAVGKGEAARIMTGAAIPRGADAVAQVEITDAGSSDVSVFQAVSVGTNVRQQGEDMHAGDVVLRSGSFIRAGEVGVLASVGKSFVTVGRRPRVAILSTGSEIVDIGGRLDPGKVMNSNAYALAALVREVGGDPRIMGIVPDSREDTIDEIRSALECDVVISSGGVSVGAYDFVKDAASELGAKIGFWRVAMKPGKPILFATLSGKPLFGLPGNPVSSMVGFHLFVGPALRRMMGLTDGCLPPSVTARATAPMTSKGDRATYLRARLRTVDGALVTEPMKVQGSGVTTSMIGANGLVVLPIGTKKVDSGDEVEVVLIGPIESA